jgi:hypothetical protein
MTREKPTLALATRPCNIVMNIPCISSHLAYECVGLHDYTAYIQNFDAPALRVQSPNVLFKPAQYTSLCLCDVYHVPCAWTA